MKSIGRSIGVVCLLIGLFFSGYAEHEPSESQSSAFLRIYRVNAVESEPMMSLRARKPLPVGLWGGEHISFDVSARSTTVEYDCAHAKINQRIFLDRNGRFNVAGTQFKERGGPVRQGGETGYPVSFSGQIKGKTMMLTVEGSTTKELVGTFTLVHGAQPKLFKCK